MTDTSKGAGERHPLTRGQRAVARRMLESKATVPDFALSIEVAMDGAMRLHGELRDQAAGEVSPSVNDIVIRACALALCRHPLANASWTSDGVESHSRVNIGFAVAAATALMVPTIFDADTKSIERIAGETRALAERARTGAIGPAELAGGTFTVTNLGMYGIASFTAIVNPPQAAILAVGTVRRAAIVGDDGGRVKAGLRMDLTLSCDHRVLYGSHAAALLADIRSNLEHPNLMR